MNKSLKMPENRQFTPIRDFARRINNQFNDGEVIRRMDQITFHETALYSAITFLRMVDPEMTIPECIKIYKSHFRINDGQLSDECARVRYYNIASKVKRAYVGKVDDGIFRSDVKSMMQSIEELFKDAILSIDETRASLNDARKIAKDIENKYKNG